MTVIKQLSVLLCVGFTAFAAFACRAHAQQAKPPAPAPAAAPPEANIIACPLGDVPTRVGNSVVCSPARRADGTLLPTKVAVAPTSAAPAASAGPQGQPPKVDPHSLSPLQLFGPKPGDTAGAAPKPAPAATAATHAPTAPRGLTCPPGQAPTTTGPSPCAVADRAHHPDLAAPLAPDGSKRRCPQGYWSRDASGIYHCRKF